MATVNDLGGYLEGYRVDYIRIDAKGPVLQGDAIIYFQHPHYYEVMKCVFENGMKNGKAILLDENSVRKFECTYVNDSIEGSANVYSNGIISFTGEFKHNTINGYGYEKQNGSVTYEGYYKDGKRNGLGQEKDMYGSLVSYCVYEDGVPLNAQVRAMEDNRFIAFFCDKTNTLERMGYIDPDIDDPTSEVDMSGCEVNRLYN